LARALLGHRDVMHNERSLAQHSLPAFWEGNSCALLVLAYGLVTLA
jgi:hypothetical protein